MTVLHPLAHLNDPHSHATGEDFVVEHDGRVIGKVGFHSFPVIGFILHPHWWDRGLSRETVAAVLRRAFEMHQLEFIDADVDPRNERSLHLLKRFGFKEVGRAKRTWNVGGQWCDSIYLRLART